MTIKAGFRAALMVGVGIAAATIVSLGYNHQTFLEDSSRSEHLDRIFNQGTQLIQLTHEVLLYGEARAVQQWGYQFKEIDATIHDASRTVEPHMRPALDTLFLRFDQLRPVQERLAGLRTGQPDSPAVPILASQLFQDAIKLQASLRELKAWSDDALKESYEKSTRRKLTIFGLFVFVAAVYGGAVSLIFRRAILGPLDHLVQTIDAIREGRAARAPVRAQDEIGAVCRAFNTLLDEQEAARKEFVVMAERFRNVFEQAAVGMSIMSPAGEWLEVNQCLCGIFGFPRDELLKLGGRAFTPPERWDADAARISGILAGERTHETWEAECQRKDGQGVVARMTTALARGDGGEPLYFVTVAEDITQRRRAENTIRAINLRLEEQARVLTRTNADLESYAWVASHDLREPLRMVATYVAMIERKLGPTINDDMRHYIGFAIEGAKRMDALIHSLLEYSRVGHAEEQVGNIPLSEIVDDCLRDFDLAIAESEATVTVAEHLPTVTGTRLSLSRLFQNVIGNALKYRDSARPPVIVISAARTDADWWTIAIADNGIGIEAEYHERVFGIFQRLHPREKYDGTGIGLAVCKKIVERLGGSIWIESVFGQGTTFRFTLPAASPGR
jgi:PAS domain S-box-containing protein